MENRINYNGDMLVSKVVEKLAEHLAKNEKLILEEYNFNNKDFLFFLHVFNNFRSVVFTHHDHIYVEMSKWEYFWNKRKCKHFNIKRINKPKNDEERIYETVPVYKMIHQSTDEIAKEQGVDSFTLLNLAAETYSLFYYEGDKKYVRNLY